MACYYCNTEVGANTYTMTISDKEPLDTSTSYSNFRLMSLDLCDDCIKRKRRRGTIGLIVGYLTSLPFAYYSIDYLMSHAEPATIKRLIYMFISFMLGFLALYLPGSVFESESLVSWIHH